MTRPPALPLSGSAPEVVSGIEGDFRLLDCTAACARVWQSEQSAVVLGVSRDAASEIDDDACARRGVAIVRRASGGGTVFVGPGTLQYAIAAPHPPGSEPPSLTRFRGACNELVRTALAAAGAAPVEQDASGDLRAGDRKVGGFAMRRRRDATMLHGTLLVAADFDLLSALLRHPAREPAWRRGRPHGEFLANLGPIDRQRFEAALARHAARITF